jgi:alkylation response protein AidB-like acyl-CoA dehydrogenase
MAREFEEFHDELRSVAGDLLAKDRTVDWPLLAEAGWIGLEAADDVGGAGVTFAEVAVICEEMGRAASANSYLGGAVLSVGTLNALQPSASRDALLTDVVSGSVRTAVVLDGIRLENQRLSGLAEFVPDAEGADRLLAIATDPDGTPVVVDTAGLTVTPQPVLDETRRLAAVAADGVEVAESAVLRFDGDPDAQVRRLLDRAAVAVACDSLGVSEAMLSATVSYAQVRHQFGRPIGSFQAVKHACADILVHISISRQLVRAAVQAVVEDHGDATTAASMAKSYACAAAVDVVGKAMQLHGGIGYTWESGIHVYLKRAALNRSLFGSPAAHRKQLAQRYLQGNLS